MRRDTTGIIDYSNLLRTLEIGQLNRSELRQMLVRENRVASTQKGSYLFALIMYGETGADAEALVIASALSSVRKMADFHFVFLSGWRRLCTNRLGLTSETK